MNTATAERGSRRDVLPLKKDPSTNEATVTIASISNEDWYISRTYGVYHIPACPKGQSCSLLLITPRSDALDLGDNRRFPFAISARQIADDLLQDLQDHGVFVCAGPRPIAEELASAKARRDAFYHRLVQDGDTLWARGHSFREISDLHRRAAIALGIEREWAYVPVRMMECPVCGEKVKEGVAVCKHCHAILNEETAAKHGLGSPRTQAALLHAERNRAAASMSPARSVSDVSENAAASTNPSQSPRT